MMKTLESRIAEYEVLKKQKVAPEILAVMAQATQALQDQGIDDHSLKVGDTAPAFSLPNQHGDVLSLNQILDESALVLSFYRGGWCPYCNLELSSLQQVLPEIEVRGARLLAISPEQPDKSLSTREKNELSFDVLHDQGNKVAETFGLVFTLPESLRSIYEKFGIDVPGHNGDDTFQLPMPATYVIGQDGQILFHFVDPDYTRRLEPSAIIDRLSGI